jgi:hypothetical protein
MKRIVMHRIGPLPPPGQHYATLESIDGLSEPLMLEHGECLRFNFRFASKAFEKRTANLLTSAKMTEYSRLHELLISIWGQQFEDGEDVTDAIRELVGQTFRITIEHREVGDAVFLNVVNVVMVSECFASMEAE